MLAALWGPKWRANHYYQNAHVHFTLIFSKTEWTGPGSDILILPSVSYKQDGLAESERASYQHS